MEQEGGFTRFRKVFDQVKIELDPMELAEVLWMAQFKIVERRKTAQVKAPEERPKKRLETPGDAKWDSEDSATEKDGEARTQLFVPGFGEPGSQGMPASEASLPGAGAIPNAAAIGRALRPLARRRRGTCHPVFDEERTAQTSAEAAMLLPVFTPAPERWFSVALVAEESGAMAVWSDTVTELADLFARHGGFNEITQWRMRFVSAGAELVSLAGGTQPLSRLNRLGAQQLILVFTDGASSRWRDDRMAHVLTQWGKSSHVVIVHLLGEKSWPNTAVGAPSLIVNAHTPGSPNRDLLAHVRSSPSAVVEGMPFPVISLDADLIQEWARMLMYPGAAYTATPIAHVSKRRATKSAKVSEPGLPALTAVERVGNFKNLVSEEAYRLAIYLSWVPLNLSVMRVVQAAMLSHPKPDHLAEFLLGGLVYRVDPGAPVLRPDRLRFEFYEGVRAALRGRTLRHEIPELDRCIEEYLSRIAGRRFRFSVLAPNPRGRQTLPVGAEEFIRLRREGLEQLGLYDRIHGQNEPEPKPPPLPLKSFHFETVTLDETGREIERRAFAAQRFIEDLGDGVALEMVEIPGGAFLMGTSEQDAEKERKEFKRYWGKESAESWVKSEMPQRRVEIKPFYLGQFQITQRQWRIVAGWEKVERDVDPNPSQFKDGVDADQRPVEQVSWEDAKEFCARLSHKTGRAYRLPTEAEWEYACRAGTITPFAFGQTITHEIVNYDSERPYAKAEKKKSRGRTIPVGSLKVANPFGLFDMHGNVWEWCEDNWHPNYDGAPTDGSAWLSGEGSSSRVLRGGSWADRSLYCRSAIRVNFHPDFRDYDIGLRVVVGARTT